MAAPDLSTFPFHLNPFAPTAYKNRGKHGYAGDDTGKHSGRKWEADTGMLHR